MFRPWRTTPSGSGSHQSRCDKRRFVPSLSGSASCLEDRVVLSGAGPVALAVHHAVVHHGHTALAQGQHGKAAAATHAAAHHGHTTRAPSHHGKAAAAIPGAVSVSTAHSSGSSATFSRTRTSYLRPVTVSPARRLGGTAAPADFRNLAVAITSPGMGRALSFSVSTTRPSTTTTVMRTTTTPSTTTAISTGGTTITPISQLPISQFPSSQLPVSQLPLSPL